MATLSAPVTSLTYALGCFWLSKHPFVISIIPMPQTTPQKPLPGFIMV
jgi:hypothetical protein